MGNQALMTIVCLGLGFASAGAVPIAGELAGFGQASWYFATDAELDLVAASLRLHAETETTCALRVEVGHKSMLAEILIATIDSPDSSEWMHVLGSGLPAHLWVGHFNTHHLQHVGYSSTNLWATRTFLGALDLTVIAHDLSPSPEESTRDLVSLGSPQAESNGRHSLVFSADCDGPVRAMLAGDNEVRFATTIYAQSGAGIWTGGGWGQVLRVCETAKYDSEDVRIRALSLGPQVMYLSLAHPNGHETWLHGLDDVYAYQQFQGGPGRYSFELDRLSYHPSSHFWAFMTGLRPIASLDDIPSLASQTAKPCHDLGGTPADAHTAELPLWEPRFHGSLADSAAPTV